MNATPTPHARCHPSRSRRLDLRDERGSLPMLMMVILVGVVLSTFMVSVVVSQTTSTRFTTSREQALNAAQAGMDVALAKIRASTTGGENTPGALAGLPCWTHRNAAAYSGSVVSDPTGTQVGSGGYSVFVDYYMTDPVVSGLDPAANPGGTMVCSPGYGTYDPASGQSTPSFALITSTGSVAGGGSNGTTAGRTLVSTYVFRIDNRNISGGVIRLYPAGANPAVCLQAGTSSPTPTTPTQVTLAPCSTTTPPSPRQLFAYRTDLTIQLVSSVTQANPDGMCLDAGSANPLVDGSYVWLRTCAVLDPTVDLFDGAHWWQQWSFDDNGHLRGSNSNSRTAAPPNNLSNICIAAAAQTAGTPVKLSVCSGSVADQNQAWIPSPAVGAGAATAPRTAADTRQYVNFGEFGRCLDVTGGNTSADHFIDYPCKQNPAPNAVRWNQVFTYFPLTSTYGQMRTTKTDDGSIWCVTSPGTLGGFVTLAGCTTTGLTAPQQRWVRNDGNNALPSNVKFTLVDYRGACLGLTDTPVAAEQWKAIDVETCGGSSELKWNAAANVTATNPQNTVEK